LSSFHSSIGIPDDENTWEKTESYDCHTSREYLGIHQKRNGKETSQYDEMLAAVQKWNAKMDTSRLSSTQNMQAITSKIVRKLLYPLPVLTLTTRECAQLTNKLFSHCLPKCGVSSKFPIQLRHLPQKYQGLGLTNLFLEQETLKIEELFTKNFTDTVLWD